MMNTMRKHAVKVLVSVMFLFAGPAVCLGAADEAQKLFESKCSSCHGIRKSTSKGMNEAQWRSTVLRMKSNGADLSREEMDKITAYLAKNYPGK